jgi:hypothetical protein
MIRSFLIAVEIPLTLLTQQRLSLRSGIVYLLADGSERSSSGGAVFLNSIPSSLSAF